LWQNGREKANPGENGDFRSRKNFSGHMGMRAVESQIQNQGKQTIPQVPGVQAEFPREDGSSMINTGFLLNKGGQGFDLLLGELRFRLFLLDL